MGSVLAGVVRLSVIGIFEEWTRDEDWSTHAHCADASLARRISTSRPWPPSSSGRGVQSLAREDVYDHHALKLCA